MQRVFVLQLGFNIASLILCRSTDCLVPNELTRQKHSASMSHHQGLPLPDYCFPILIPTRGRPQGGPSSGTLRAWESSSRSVPFALASLSLASSYHAFCPSCLSRPLPKNAPRSESSAALGLFRIQVHVAGVTLNVNRIRYAVTWTTPVLRWRAPLTVPTPSLTPTLISLTRRH